MIAVIFEVWPASGRKEDYLAIAAKLRTELEKMDGFISVERFQSLTDPGKLLSLSFWRDEDAVKQLAEPGRSPAESGRRPRGVFADYRLRIASVVRDYGMAERGAGAGGFAGLPQDLSPARAWAAMRAALILPAEPCYIGVNRINTGHTMTAQSLGYLGVRAKDLGDWGTYGSRCSGCSASTRARARWPSAWTTASSASSSMRMAARA